jgi:hypothetical protein
LELFNWIGRAPNRIGRRRVHPTHGVYGSHDDHQFLIFSIPAQDEWLGIGPEPSRCKNVKIYYEVASAR